MILKGYLFGKLSPDINISIFSIAPEGVVINGNSTNIESIRKMYESIKSESRFKVVNLESIDKKDGSFEFNLSLSEYNNG